MSNRLARFFVSYLLSLGMSVIVLAFLSLALDKLKPMDEFIYAFIFGLFPSALMNALFWDKNDDAVELWIKRIYYCVVSIGFLAFCVLVFRGQLTIEKFAICFGTGLGAQTLVVVPLWIILDRRQKRMLDRINEKLKENKYE